jgi:polyisoprenoid-binding protein YceI
MPRLVIVLSFVALFGVAGAGQLEPIDAETVLAIVTHRGGVASGLAHDHFVVATGYDLRVTFDRSAPEKTTFELDVPVERLAVDDPALQEKWFPRIRDLGVLADPFESVPDKKRAKIRRTMLGRKQLDAEQFPRITARVRAVRQVTAEQELPWVADVVVEVHGESVERAVPARHEVADGKVTLEALGKFRFSEFGIAHYSAFLGAVKNRDEFHLWVRVHAALAD